MVVIVIVGGGFWCWGWGRGIGGGIGGVEVVEQDLRGEKRERLVGEVDEVPLGLDPKRLAVFPYF